MKMLVEAILLASLIVLAGIVVGPSLTGMSFVEISHINMTLGSTYVLEAGSSVLVAPVEGLDVSVNGSRVSILGLESGSFNLTLLSEGVSQDILVNVKQVVPMLGKLRTSANEPVGKKVEDDSSFETEFLSVEKSSTHLVLEFQHTSGVAQPVWIEEDVEYSLSDDVLSPGETAVLEVPLLDSRIPKFRLHIGAASEVFEFGISIINVQSYPVVGGLWRVMFNTTGTQDLEITAINGTEWGVDLELQGIKCGGTSRNYTFNGTTYVLENYSCDALGEASSMVLTQGKHVLRFDFGGESAFAFNDAFSNISSCGNITAPGAYRLNQSLFSSVSCLFVNASNSVIDCDAFSIAGSGAGAGINVSASNVTVRNCTVVGFSTGVIMNGSNLTVLNSVAWNNTLDGFFSRGRNVSFVSSTARNNSDDGFDIQSENSTVNGCDSLQNGNTGFRCASLASGTVFRNLVARNSTTNGFNINCAGFLGVNLTGEANGLNSSWNGFYAGAVFAVHNSTMEGNGNYGFFLNAEGSATGCAARDNTDAGFFANSSVAFGSCVAARNADGFKVWVPSSLDSNTADNNSLDGFFVMGASSTNFTSNLASNNSDDGFDLTLLEHGSLTNDRALGNAGDGVELFESNFTRILNLTSSGNSRPVSLLGAVDTDINDSTLGSNTLPLLVNDTSALLFSGSRVDSIIMLTQDVVALDSNFSALSVQNANGSLNYTQMLIVSDADFSVNVSIGNNSIAGLDASARLLFRNILFENPQPIVNDSSGFVACSAPRCVEVSFSNNVFVYDVTGFSTYGSNETPPSSAAAPRAASGGRSGGGGGAAFTTSVETGPSEQPAPSKEVIVESPVIAEPAEEIPKAQEEVVPPRKVTGTTARHVEPSMPYWLALSALFAVLAAGIFSVWILFAFRR